MKTETTIINNAGVSSDAAKKRMRAWMCARIVDYRFQALSLEDSADEDSSHCWSDLGPDTIISTDRESVFQLARANGGLLLCVEGLPNGARCSAVAARAKAVAAAPF